MRTLFRLLAIAALIAGASYYLLRSGAPSEATPVTVDSIVQAAPVEVAAQPAPQGVTTNEIYLSLDCARVDARYPDSASYQMDGPMGMAPDEDIHAWHAMGKAERVGFLAWCGKDTEPWNTQ